ncbi:hypothetical protein Tco_0935433 [Tanacetum coccineum]
MYYPRFTKVIIHYFLTQYKTLSWRNKIGMHTSMDDYLINTLRFVFAKEETQIYGAILHEMKETKSYKTYFDFATGATPPKKAQKFKKPASPKLTTVPASTEEPTRKSKRVKRPAKKYTKDPVRGVVIRENPEITLSKKKEKVDVTRGKGIELLSQVALNEDAQFEEVRMKSMRDFHKTHPSSSGAVKIIPSVTSEGIGVKPGVPDVTEEESSEKENKEDDDDEEEVKDELVKTPSNDSDDEDETNITDKAEGDEDEEMDYTTSQLYDDVDIRLNEPKTEVPVISSSYSSDLAAKFLNFSDIPHTDAEIVSPMDVHVYHEVPSKQTPTLLTIPISVISDSSPVFSTVIPQLIPSFTPLPPQSTPTPPPTTEARNPPSSFPNFASVF